MTNMNALIFTNESGSLLVVMCSAWALACDAAGLLPSGQWEPLDKGGDSKDDSTKYYR